MRSRAGRIAPEERKQLSDAALKLLQLQPAWRQSGTVLLFASLPDELDIWPLLEAGLALGKQMGLPQYDTSTASYSAARIQDCAQDLCAGKFGIREPRPGREKMELNRLDLVLVPGLAFDLHGSRLGRGKGFYDRLLAKVRGTTCGIAYDHQIVSVVPAEPHDIHVDCILTPARWIDLQTARRF
jgi:5-formyltetrahydrofolate cyclo-ligase